ncbi:unnamed protein product [Periconia digitata]|uniref:PH domain-containing protein n=1 Tax=Periconia digitata TaxID=1303443 RepID=A0A9W4UPQ9_9PLEO|nr:unnamed protein product [Periconia digitata]
MASQHGYQSNSVPAPNDPSHLSRGYGDSSHLNVDVNDFGSMPANHTESSPLAQSLPEAQRRGRFEETFDARTRGSSIIDPNERLERSTSRASTLNQGAAPSRSGTLKKRSSVKRSGSLKRSGSRKSLHAGSIRGVSIEDEGPASSKHNNVFYTPVPTSGSPTEILANRFQAWRKLLKDLIAYFREVATSYEHRAKALLKVSNVINNTNAPTLFLTEGGLNDANRILRDYHKQSVAEANKAKDIQGEIINQLSGLRADLSHKIKEIKSLSGDFKNSVEKEKEVTRKCVAALEESLSLVDLDPAAIAGKGDPFVVRLGVERQVERQIDEENYLHRAYLNLENSGRELESIVVGEIQKAYNALANILKREADESYSTIERLRSGPVGMPRDQEWNEFVTQDPHFVNPSISLRRLEDIEYPGKHHPAAAEVRAGMLERKSKYLKSYTPGWYVLSPTHLHEFKSADRIYTQPPVMSLLLSDQKLGSHSQPGSSSHKFVLKGRQTGSMHRGHTWVFRAETYDTMLAWRDDIQNLIDKTGDERNAFVRRTTSHRRSISAGSTRSFSSGGGDLDEDEADAVPFSASQSLVGQQPQEAEPQPRPSPGGRFPSDIQVQRHLQTPRVPSSRSSSEIGQDVTTISGGLQGSHPPNMAAAAPYDSVHQEYHSNANENPYEYNPNRANQQHVPPPLQQQDSYFEKNPPRNYTSEPHPSYDYDPSQNLTQDNYQPRPRDNLAAYSNGPEQRPLSDYADWMSPAAGTVAGAAVGAVGADAYHRHQQEQQREMDAHYDPADIQPLPERHPDHIAPINPTGTLTPAPGVSTTEIHAPSPLSFTNVADQSFLDGAQVLPSRFSTTTAGTFSPSIAGEKVDGGPVLIPGTNAPVEPPSVKRQNTDFSVSDLHVPGEYPKGSGPAKV